MELTEGHRNGIAGGSGGLSGGSGAGAGGASTQTSTGGGTFRLCT